MMIKTINKINTGLLFLFLFLASVLNAQKDSIYIIDEVLAVIGDEIVLKSDLELQKVQMRQDAVPFEGDMDCFALENMMTQKLFLDQGKVDTVEASEELIQTELSRRIAMFIQQIGSQQALEEYFGKTIVEIKKDFHDPLEEQMITQQVQQSITQFVNVTPSDVQNFYNNIPKDSLPEINTQVEYAQLVIYPRDNPEEIEKCKQRLRGFIKEVREGEDFETLAVLYSDDPGSAPKGGDLGMVPRGAMVSEFDEVAFQLSNGEISAVFETEFGYHIMKMIERRGEQYHAEHILLKPKTTTADMRAAKEKIESIESLIKNDSISWRQAVYRNSMDEKTNQNDGLVINLQSNTPRFDLSQLDPQAYVAIESMKTDDISPPVLYQTREGKDGYRLIRLLQKIEPHRANLTDDYQTLQDAATNQIRQETIQKWIKKKITRTYIRINKKYVTCDFEYKWVKAEN